MLFWQNSIASCTILKIVLLSSAILEEGKIKIALLSNDILEEGKIKMSLFGTLSFW